MNDPRLELKRRLKSLANAAPGLKQQRMADKIGVSRATLWSALDPAQGVPADSTITKIVDYANKVYGEAPPSPTYADFEELSELARQAREQVGRSSDYLLYATPAAPL